MDRRGINVWRQSLWRRLVPGPASKSVPEPSGLERDCSQGRVTPLTFFWSTVAFFLGALSLVGLSAVRTSALSLDSFRPLMLSLSISASRGPTKTEAGRLVQAVEERVHVVSDVITHHKVEFTAGARVGVGPAGPLIKGVLCPGG